MFQPSRDYKLRHGLTYASKTVKSSKTWRLSISLIPTVFFLGNWKNVETNYSLLAPVIVFSLHMEEGLQLNEELVGAQN